MTLRYDGQTGAFMDVFVADVGNAAFGLSDLFFGPDNLLYVADSGGIGTSGILRFHATTGLFVDVFVSEGSGGFGSSDFNGHHTYDACFAIVAAAQINRRRD